MGSMLETSARLLRLLSLLQSVTVPLPVGAAVVRAETLTVIAVACRGHERLRFDYRSHEGTASLRTTEPYRLVHTGRRWYLVAWDPDRAGWRTFRVDRMQARTPTGPRFTPRTPPADVAGYAAWSVTNAAYRYRGRFTVHAPAEAVADLVSPTSGIVEAIDDGTCILRTGAHSLDALALHVALLGFEFEVDDPPELASRVRALAGRLARAAPLSLADGDPGDR